MAAQSKERLSRIREENAQLEAVLSGMAEGVMVTSAEGRILMVNPAFKRMMDVDAWCLNKRPIEVVRNHDLQSVVDAAIDSAPSLHEDTVFDLTLEWNQRIFQVHLTPVRIGEQLHGVVAVFHDMTELRRLEQVRKDFVANVSHELRTPLTSIKGFVETLLDGAMEDTAALRRFMTSIQHHADRLQALVEDLLQLSSIESGRYEVEFTSCRLDRVSERVAEIFAKQVDRKQLALSLRFETDRPARGDPELMERALSNLVDNAVKYTENGGSITIGTEERVDEIVLSVSDTGPGIPSEALPRIFERFFRVDRARSRALGGTGLGLAIVRHTMELLNGRAWVESRLGEGATFYLSLPAWTENEPSEDEQSEVTGRPARTPGESVGETTTGGTT
ncbi:MAG: PAS domain S-box protein [Gemmatimonadetes bacterium]|nr:PAS domain S-box protein [Gemmatimonadota bacterium]